MKNAFLRESEAKQALNEFILKASRLSMGEKCEEFEARFGEFQGRKYTVLFNSGASANLALLQAYKNLGLLKEGDHVGFSALTWSTNVMPIIQMGLIPVPIDCSFGTINVMSENLKERHEQLPLQAYFSTNVLGLAGDLQNIKDYCARKSILYFEDNCESLNSKLNGTKTGNFGHASTFSFFVAHHMSTIEGGAVCTDDENLSDMLKITRANGWDRNLNAEKQRSLREKYGIDSEFRAKYTFYDLGFNLRPTEITGALGLHQLQYLSENCRIRQENFERISKRLKQNDDFYGLDTRHMEFIPTFAMPILSKSKALKEKYVSKFLKSDIEIRPIIAGCMQRQPFYSKYVERIFELPGADRIDDLGFYCGNYPELNESDLQTIEAALEK